jgi:hypothetical protein
VTGEREAADRLARLLADQRGAEIIGALQQVAQAAGGQRPADDTKPAQPPIAGAWQIVGTPQGPALRRRPHIPASTSRAWSSVAEVPGKGNARRVVLVGESVARGVLIDPVFNPALALEHYLNPSGGPPAFQCVDLARGAMGLPGLRWVTTAVRRLDADVLVVFAGNNWSREENIGLPPALGDVLRHRGYQGVRDAVLKEAVLPQARAFLAELLRLRAGSEIRLVVVIPEFNLTGWSPLGGNAPDVPMLPEEALRSWYELRRDALAASGRGDWAQVRQAATDMERLDQGLSPVPSYLLGGALAAVGDFEGAREAYERSRDSICGLFLNHGGRTPRVIQDMLRDFCRSNDIDCVDVPRLLAGDGAGLPDPAHFYDDCHMSDTGIAITMAEVAAVISGSRTDWRDHHATLVSDWQAAVSLVLAATVNSYLGQPAAVIRGYLKRALDTCPQIAGFMASLERVASRPGGPLWSAPDFADIAKEANAARRFIPAAGYSPDRSRTWDLRENIAELTGAAPVAEPAARRAAVTGPRELLDITATSLGPAIVANLTPRVSYLQANTTVTQIMLHLDAADGGLLRLTHRRREGNAEPAVVRFNGHLVGQFTGARTWAVSAFAVPPAVTRRGMNLMEITWPGPAVSWRTRLEEDVAALARGECPYVLPLFGELYSATFGPDHPAGHAGGEPTA